MLPGWAQTLINIYNWRSRQTRRGPLLLEQGLQRVSWEDNPTFERWNENYFSTFREELPSNLGTASIAAGTVGTGVYYAGQQIADQINFSELPWLNFLHNYNMGDDHQPKRSRTMSNTNAAFNPVQVDGIDRVMGPQMPSLDNAGNMPNADAWIPFMRLLNVPTIPEASTSLNTLEPNCCNNWKCFDWYFGAAAVPAVVSSEILSSASKIIGLTSQITQGAGDNQRIGNTIYLHCAMLRYSLRTGSTSTQTNEARCLLVYDRQANTSQIAGMFRANNGPLDGATGGSDPWTFYNRSTRDRYDIMYDRFLQVGQNIVTASVNDHMPSSDVCYGMIPLNNLEVVYDNTNAVPHTGHLMLMHCGTTPAAAGHIFSGGIRIYYSEKQDRCLKQVI